MKTVSTVLLSILIFSMIFILPNAEANHKVKKDSSNAEQTKKKIIEELTKKQQKYKDAKIQNDAVKAERVKTATTFANTLFNPSYYTAKQNESLSAYSQDFIKGLVDPLDKIAITLGITTYSDASQAIKSMVATIGVITAANYSMLYITCPIMTTPNDLKFQKSFSDLATQIQNDNVDKKFLRTTITRLNDLKANMDSCPDANLMAWDVSAIKANAKYGVDGAIKFLEAEIKK